jgi:hypothetical protein
VVELFPPDERRTSFHEAGHALIGLHRGLHLEALQMEPLAGLAGGTRFREPIPERVPLDAPPDVREYLEGWIDVLVAGDEAALEATGTDDPGRAHDDLGHALRLANHWVFDDPAALTVVVDAHRPRVRAELCVEWATVQAIAEALRERRALSADEVQAIIAATGPR